MNGIVSLLAANGVVTTALQRIAPETVGIRKKIALYTGCDMKHYYLAAVEWPGKTRFVIKDVALLEEGIGRLESLHGHAIRRRYVCIPNAPVCSKASKALQQNGWKVLRAAV